VIGDGAVLESGDPWSSDLVDQHGLASNESRAKHVTGQGHLAQIGDKALDLKKAGIFPLVHGVRSLALEARLACTNTVERIEALRAMGRLPPDVAAELVDSLHFLMGLKLQAGLEAKGGSNGRVIQQDSLTSLQRDLLKDSLAVVKRFQAMLRHRYRLDML